ncbi:MAG: apolipoprotein N-acyltransferase [Saprospiraceae bacterium]
MLASYAAMVIFGCFSAAWLFNFPQAQAEIAVIFFLEEFYFFFPFLPYFFLQKRMGFERALWLFPLLWMLWEWIYLGLEFTMGTHLSAYSQSSNIWLIQYIDITGMWGVSFWLMLFNVLIYKVYKTSKGQFRSSRFLKRITFICTAMLGIPLLYTFYSFGQYREVSLSAATLSLLPTQFTSTYLSDPTKRVSIVEQTLHRNDSLAFAQQAKGVQSDLYVWPETGLNFELAYSNLGNLLSEATYDWGTALLTGCKGVPSEESQLDTRRHVSGVLLDPIAESVAFHHKTVLTPGQEAIPYHTSLARLPNFPIAETDPHYFKKGIESQPLTLKTKNQRSFQVGVSLCYEQWYPSHWTRLAKNGSDFYVHLAGEGWYGNIGFQQFMANVSRMRCIENRRQAARCANVGLSMFIDQFGRIKKVVKQGSLDTITDKLHTSNTITSYARYPALVPYLGMLTLLIGLIRTLFSKSKNKVA